MDTDESKSPSNTIVLEFKEDNALTEVRLLLLNFRCRTEKSVGTMCGCKFQNKVQLDQSKYSF